MPRVLCKPCLEMSPPLSSPVDLLTDSLSDAPLSADQRDVWRGLCEELVLARVRIQELETRLKIMERSKPDDETPGASLLTRPDFNREVARLLALDERYGNTSSVLYFDIENLQAVKDRHGAALAQAALQAVGEALLTHVRRSDVVGQLAPDEFGVLLPRCDNPNAWLKGEAIASLLHVTLAKVWGPGLEPVISYGAYTFADKEDVAQGLKNAGAALTRLGKG